MATPRLFISSTCYDLQEIRFQLRKFIEDIGYEPVMSDFGDIFYDLGKHVQDACKEEIIKCNIFILIIGNNYGSIYHKHSDTSHIPDSITLQEFRKAIEVGVPKYIFINRFVKHDFENYRRVLNKQLAKYFTNNEVSDEDIEKTKSQLKKKFDTTYPFPQDAYQYVFYFLDEIYNLDTNNAVYPFESFDNIKDSLKKQWAGFFFDALTKEQSVPLDRLNVLEQKLGKIEHQLKLLMEKITVRNDNQTMTIDIANLTRGLDIENLTELQNRLDEILFNLIYAGDEFSGSYPLIIFTEDFDEQLISKWIDKIGELLKDYKWSKEIPATEIFSMFDYEFENSSYSIPYKDLLELFEIINSISDEDMPPLYKTIVAKFSELRKDISTYPLPPDEVPF